MSDKKGAPRNHWVQWTVDEITFVEQHYGQLSAREIGERLGRSVPGYAATLVGKGTGVDAGALQERALLW